MGRLAAVLTAAAVLASSSIAIAGPRILLAPVYGEPDVEDSAGALALLVRSAFDAAEPGTIAQVAPTAPRPTLDRAADTVHAADAEVLVLASVDRLGPTLIATAQVIDRTGAVIGRVAVQAADGAIGDLATAFAKDLGTAVGIAPAAIPELSIGQIRPFVIAEHLVAIGKPADAARALAGADPVIALRVSAAGAAARVLWADPTLDAGSRLAACIVGGTPRDVMMLTADDASAAARSARALVKVGMSDAAGATLEMTGIATGPDTALARAAIAQLKHDLRARDAAIGELIATPAAADRTALAWIARLAPGVLPAATEAAVIGAAEQLGDRRIAAVIGLRAVEAKIGIDRALALIAVVELDRSERARLRVVLKSATGTEAVRLAAEQALADGDLVGAKAALGQLRRATDPRAALYRGRIAWALGDLATAADELAIAAADGEHARVLLAAGDVRGAHKAAGDEPRSRVAQLATAEVALLENRPADAMKPLRLAEELSPGDRDVQVRLATALEPTGDKAGASRVRARLASLGKAKAPPAAPVDLAGSGSGSGSGGSDDGSAGARVLTPAQTSLRGTLRDLLAGFPPAAVTFHSLVFAPIGAEPSGWALHEIDPEPLLRQLRAVLEAEPYHSRVVATTERRLPDPPAGSELAELATTNGANGVLLYDVDDDGAVRLVVFDADSGLAFEQRGTINVGAMDMVHWNLRWLLIPISIASVLALLILVAVVRGSGVIEVKVKLDPNGTNEVLCLEVQRSRRRWVIRDMEAFRATTTTAGAKVGRRTARLIGGMTRFKVPPGHWYVHLYGIYERPGGTRLLDDQQTAEVDLGRNATRTVEIDLVPRTAELRIKVYDDNPRGVTLTLDDGASRFYPDAKGECVIYSPMGDHTLHVEAKGIKLARQFAVHTPMVEHIEINLSKERKLAEVSDGLTLQKRAVSEAIPVLREAEVDLEQLERATAVPPIAAEPAAVVAPAAAVSTPVRPPAASVAKMAAAATISSPQAATSVLPQAPLPSGLAIGSATSTPELLCGRYRITKMLGRGAMGVVYRAHDENLEREVAVKVLAAELRSHPDAMRLFAEEARALAQLNHPNIVSVYDQATDGSDTYLIMEYVNGRTLDSLLEEKGKIAVHTALALIDQLCAGLTYVHARRVIHRDIKPANIFVSRERVVKLGDFGLARVMRELSIRKTEIRGTPLYMAPEQITGENVTHRSDLYAVGCTLFELVTGRPPFMDGEILYHHMHTEPPKPSDLEPTLSPAFDELVLSCIAKQADERIESAQAIRDKIRMLSTPGTVKPG